MLGLLLALTLKPMTVTETTSTTVYVTDYSGDEWSFYGDGYEVGTEIAVVMVNGKIVDIKE